VVDGLVVVDKPAGWTSHDVVGKLRKVYGQKRVGHAGTLDPDATGVLLVGLGRATRLLRFLQEAGKSYRARIQFGIATDTLDAAGAVLERAEMTLTREQVEKATTAFLGDIEQIPPMVSAIKVGGRKLYEMARAGEEIERAPRPVRIDAFVIEEFEPGPYPIATARVDCSTGTYVRSLAADLGTILGGCAHLAGLRRLRVGSFSVEESAPLDAIEADPNTQVLTPAQAMRDLPAIVASGDLAVRSVSTGSTSWIIGFAVPEVPLFTVVDDRGTLLAVYERTSRGVKPVVVVAGQA
jgi:tRNA pseudouridine55 synthase